MRIDLSVILGLKEGVVPTGATLFSWNSKISLPLETVSVKPRVWAEPSEPKAPYWMVLFRLRMDSSLSIIILYESCLNRSQMASAVSSLGI